MHYIIIFPPLLWNVSFDTPVDEIHVGREPFLRRDGFEWDVETVRLHWWQKAAANVREDHIKGIQLVLKMEKWSESKQTPRRFQHPRSWDWSHVMGSMGIESTREVQVRRNDENLILFISTVLRIGHRSRSVPFIHWPVIIAGHDLFQCWHSDEY